MLPSAETAPVAPASGASAGGRRRLGSARVQEFLRVVGAFVGAQVVVILTSPVIARGLSVDDRGRFALLLSVSTTVGLISTLGLPAGIVHHAGAAGARPPCPRPTWRLLVLLSTTASVVGAGILALAFDDRTRYPVAAVGASALILLATCWQYLVSAVLLGLQRPQQYQRLALVNGGIWLVGVVGLYVTHRTSVTTLAVVYAVSVALPTLYEAAKTFGQGGPWAPGTPTGDAAGTRILSFGLRGFIGLMPPSEAVSVELLFASAVLDAAGLGLFVVASTFRAAGRMVGAGVSTYALAAHSRVLDPVARRRHARQVVLASTALAVVLTAPLVVLAGPLTRLVFGASYADAADAARILAVAGGAALVGRAWRGLRLADGVPGRMSLAEIGSLGALALVLLLPIGWTVTELAVAVCGVEVIRLVLTVALSGANRRAADDPDDVADDALVELLAVDELAVT